MLYDHATDFPVFCEEGEEISISAEGDIKSVSFKEGKAVLVIDKLSLASLKGKDFSLQLRIDCEEEALRSDLIPGARIAFFGSFSHLMRATNPGCFDYERYGYSQGILGQVKGKLSDIRLLKSAPFYRKWLSRIRFSLKDHILSLADEKDAGILICILTGDKGGLTDYWKKLYQDGGIIHLLTLSGLHVSVLGMGLYSLLMKLTGHLSLSAFLSSFLLITFLILSGGGSSMVRAVLCYLILVTGRVLGRQADNLTGVCTALLLLLMEHPLILFESGFLMMTGSLFGITILLPMAEVIFCGEKPYDHYLKSLLTASLMQLSSLFAVLYFNGAAPLYGTFINMLTVPFMGLVFIAAFLSVLVSYVLPFLGLFFMGTAHVILAWYERVCLFFDGMPHARFVGGRPYLWQLFFGFLLLLTVFIYLYRESIWKRKRLSLLTGLVFLPLGFLFLLRYQSADLTVYFLDVGQGDGIVMDLPGRQGILCVDGGSSSNKELNTYVYQPFLNYLGADHVDYWFITHPDFDHYSAMAELLSEGFAIDHILIPEGFKDHELVKTFETYQPVEFIRAGDVLSVGDFSLSVLSPEVSENYFDDNDGSAVLLAGYGDFHMLLTGDISTRPEGKVLDRLKDQKIDILKAAHHGSASSTSQDFLFSIRPKTTVISCALKNKYGHPAKETIERLESVGSDIIRTTKLGCIMVKSDGKGYEIRGFLK